MPIITSGKNLLTDSIISSAKTNIPIHIGIIKNNNEDNVQPQETTDKIIYLIKEDNGEYNHIPEEHNYWNKMVLETPD